MSIRPLICPSWVELSGDEVTQLLSVPYPTLQVRRHYRCELEAGHDSRHASLVQGSFDGVKPATWWIWWTSAGDHDIAAADSCPVAREDEEPPRDDQDDDADQCLLPSDHPGSHRF